MVSRIPALSYVYPRIDELREIPGDALATTKLPRNPLAPNDAAIKNISSIALDGIWDVNKPEVVTPIRLYHMIRRPLLTNNMAIGAQIRLEISGRPKMDQFH
ncbi:uncharacterized protein BCR38DRAFT_415194 [Pseudomassariella vexata]|uniref:Uncharacterized protein n=1 Tax=Pseudomassariella vexata TaxID=1141098 RepID=A0A1Y2D6J1_9PEZI|nr:uncharacterized protein BCR38DRAFT_415194 [Pseudomassariella vexata]ORY54696.1 hypothetical protein BCR38DRAFT_415194 [Pseudomassariella vexata]